MSTNTTIVKPYIARGIFVFVSGMALAGISFLVENFIVKAAQNRA